MEGNKNRSRALLVFGAPCSGKTTFSENFSRKFGLAYYDLDEIMSENNFSPENMMTILELIARTHQTIVIEGGIKTELQRTELRNALRQFGYEPYLIWVQTDMATIRMRLKSRYKSISKAKSIYEEAVKELEAPTDIEKPIILSGKHTFETQTKHVLAALADLADAK